jgi:hypothetical protein
MFNLNAHPNAGWAKKLLIPVKVIFALTDGVCETLEGPVSYQAGDAIMTGVDNEQWPIERHKFEATYDAQPPTLPGENGLYFKKPIPVRVVQLTEPIKVEVGSQANKIQGQIGDWLIEYGPENFGIVSKDIFSKTYILLNEDKL